jgi:HK97 family phage portal protein
MAKIPFLSRIKSVFSPRFDEIISAYLKGEDVSIIGIISEDVKMKYSAVFACFRVLAETFASVPIFEYKKINDSDRVKTNDTGLYDVLHNSANDEMSAYNLKEALMYQICAGGNAVARRLKGRYNNTTGLYPLEWQRLEIKRDKDTGKLIYEYRIGAKTEIFQRSDVLHIPGPSMNGVVGMSILEYASASIGLGMTYDKFGQKYFENGAFPSGKFEMPGHLKDGTEQIFMKGLKERYYEMSKKGIPLFLEDGLKYTPFDLKLVDAQMLESKKFSVEDICRFCRVPLHLVQNLDKATNNNIEHQSLEFAMYTMLPHFKRAEECINCQLLSSKQRQNGYYYEFDMNALVRGDFKSRMEGYNIARMGGWKSVNDIRKLENDPAIPNGDIYLQPLNYYEAGKEPPEKAVPTSEKVSPEEGVKKEIENLISDRS